MPLICKIGHPNLYKVPGYTEYDFYKATQTLNAVLKQKRPKTFDPLWIERNVEDLYKYLSRYVQTDSGEVDWDAVTLTLDRRFQKRWYWYRPKRVLDAIPYENKHELDGILSKYQNKLYTALVSVNEQEEKIRDQIFIGLVRLAQKGNVLAQKQIIDWLNFVINEWIESLSDFAKWKGYPDDITKRIQACIRCYRYTGTFIGYVYRTFHYSARGLLHTSSLNDPVGKGTKTRIDYVMKEDGTINDW